MSLPASFIVPLMLVINNSIVLIGPAAWSGVGVRRVAAVYAAASFVGALTPWMPRLSLDIPSLIYASSVYLATTVARVSTPLSILVYAMNGVGVAALVVWLLSPLIAMPIAYVVARRRRLATKLFIPSMLVSAFLFGANNLAMFVCGPVDAASVAVATVVGSLLGSRYSVWVAELVGVGRVVAASSNTAVAAGVGLGVMLGIPMSATLLAYSALLAASLASPLRMVRIGRFLRAYAALLLAISSAEAYSALKVFLAGAYQT